MIMANLVDKVKEGVKSFSEGVKKNARNAVVYTALGVGALAGSSYASSFTLENGFEDLTWKSGNSQIIKNSIDYSARTGDNLMIKDEAGVESVVSKEGVVENNHWAGDIWRIGFGRYIDGGFLFGGYANNDNSISNNHEGFEGWCVCDFYDGVFPEGSRADEVFIVHDKLGDGIGEWSNGNWALGIDDDLYRTGDIEFNGIQGGIDELGPLSYLSPDGVILPHMTINKVPEPASLAVFGLGLALALAGRKRKNAYSNSSD